MSKVIVGSFVKHRGIRIMINSILLVAFSLIAIGFCIWYFKKSLAD